MIGVERLLQLIFVVLAGTSKISAALLSYNYQYGGSITQVDPYKSEQRLSIYSGISGVFNLVYTTFEFLGGVPS